MAKHRNWSAKEKLDIVLEIMQNGNISEACRKHGIYESQFYGWKKILEECAGDIFKNRKKQDPKKERLEKEKKQLEKTIVDLSCELHIFKKRTDRTSWFSYP